MTPNTIKPDPVHQLRLIIEAEDFDAAVAFYRDALGLTEQAAFQGEGDARVMILNAGLATLSRGLPTRRGNAARSPYTNSMIAGITRSGTPDSSRRAVGAKITS